MFRVQVFQHVPFEGLGSMESVFREAGASVNHTHWFQGETSSAPDAFDMLVIMGGPMGTYDEEKFPWLKQEKDAIKRAPEAGRPVLGICLGSQLLAEVLGGQVTRNGHKEIGWFPVEKVSEGSASWVSKIFPERFNTFHWHGDTFSIPSGARLLFQSEGCAHQGFVWNEQAVGLQFHPEILPEVISSWIENGDEEVQAGGRYVQTPEKMRGHSEDFKANNGFVASLCHELMRRSDPKETAGEF